MTIFGNVAVLAIKLMNDGKARSPVDAWEMSVDTLITSVSMRSKGCPKSAFLGLCEEGYIKNIKPGHYTKSKKNKAYAIRALFLLKDNPKLAENPNLIWEMVTHSKIKHNGQIDVVLSLWNAHTFKF